MAGSHSAGGMDKKPEADRGARPDGAQLPPGTSVDATTGREREREPVIRPVEAPAVTVPKGGGAIRPLGEAFQVSAATGTGSLSVPVYASPGRGGKGPSLAVAYDSGAGNGPFGLGWSLSAPSIGRKTSEGLPRYRGGDTFVLSGGEDLVPVPGDDDGSGDHRVERFHPRTEGAFARIERLTERATGEVSWRVTDRDNRTRIYGGPVPEDGSWGATPRIVDPADPRRVFRWLLQRTYDDQGNVTVFEYAAEDGAGVSANAPYEAGRAGQASYPQRYLKRVLWGNDQWKDGGADDFAYTRGEFHFELVFDYHDHDEFQPTADPTGAWDVRDDPFSSHRAGFEVRTWRLCRRVLMFHRFAELGPEPLLVRSTSFHYADDPVATKLVKISQEGWLRGDDGLYEAPTPFPPLELSYTAGAPEPTIRTLDAESAENLPAGVDGRQLGLGRWVDLDGEGVSGVLHEAGGAWHYKRYLGEGRWGAARKLDAMPALAASSNAQLVDLAGDGHLDVVTWAGAAGGGLAGYHARTDAGSWEPLRRFRYVPRVLFDDPDLRLVDLTGDGQADILRSEQEAFVWHPSLARDGYGDSERVTKGEDEETGPTLVFGDGSQTAFLADMSGDGLPDLVRIREAEVCYWPNLGYGRFGHKVQMGSPPRLATGPRFDPGRIRLADVDGSGTTDIVYLAAEGVRYYPNQSGNSWGDAVELGWLPPTDDLADVAVVDLLGQGTACLVWTSPAPRDAAAPLRYIDLMGGIKPHLLCRTENNLGLTTEVHYAPSTRMYLEDRAAGQPWACTPPFPVHVVERVVAVDAVSDTRLTSRYRYRHGYFDGDEREFRGFGFVEQWDAEEVAASTGETLDVPPVRTRTWYHTGAWREGEALSRQYAGEYWQGGGAGGAAFELPDTVLPPGLETADEKEAARALRGTVLRQEVYADDGTALASEPYKVAERTFMIRLVQPGQPPASSEPVAPGEVGRRLPAVLLPHEAEAIDLYYERKTSTRPRIAHRLTLEVDDYGNVTRSAAVAYGDPIRYERQQRETVVTVSERSLLYQESADGPWRPGLPTESRRWQVHGFEESTGARLRADQLLAALDDPAYSLEPVSWSRTLYHSDAVNTPAPHGTAGDKALAYETYAHALDAGHADLLLDKLGGDAAALEQTLGVDGGFTQLDATGAPLPAGGWWARTGHADVDEAHFCAPTVTYDPFGNPTTATWDDATLVVTAVEDALHNRTTAEIDYRVLAPALVTDPNGNRTAVAFDALGQVTRGALMGKAGAGEGDTLESPTTELTYDLMAWHDSKDLAEPLPAWVRSRAREVHGVPESETPWQRSRSFYDGLGRVAAAKVQAEPDDTGAERWVGTGRKVLNNKGLVVKQYEPYFTTGDGWDTEAELVEQGVTPVMHYDPLGRLVRTDRPEGTFTTVAFDPWEMRSEDTNDNVLESEWYARRTGSGDLASNAAEARAAELTAAHAHTPSYARFDALGRGYVSVVDAGPEGKHETFLELDIRGNLLEIVDARGVQTHRATYDLLNRPLHTASRDAGQRWMATDYAGQPLRAWGERDFGFRYEYDSLRRVTRSWTKQGGGDERLTEAIVYGERLDPPDIADCTSGVAAARNLRGIAYLALDQSGVARSVELDFAGNLLESERWLAKLALGGLGDVASAADLATDPLAIDYAGLDWTAAPDDLLAGAAAAGLLEDTPYRRLATYDALGRATEFTEPDGSVVTPTYNEAGLLETLSVQQTGDTAPRTFVSDIDHNARGQRTAIYYGNGVTTTYTYEDDTFRLSRLESIKANGTRLQGLGYTYDPAGNITQITDDAQQTVFFANAEVEPTTWYEYDPLYRLRKATGREHAGQTADVRPGHTSDFSYPLPHPSDTQAVRAYTQSYAYDAVGNILELLHRVSSGGTSGWSRYYAYDTGSNRLHETRSDPEPGPTTVYESFTYDAHGNMTTMPHLAAMVWGPRDELRLADKGTGGGRVHFVYNAGGERIRKLYAHEKTVEETLYFGGVDIYRKWQLDNDGNGTIATERETLHVMDDHQRIALVETKTIDETQGPLDPPETRIRYQLGNHLGSAAVEVAGGSGAKIISYEEYHPFGTTSYRATDGSLEASPKRYRYTGKERDESTGLYYHGLRYYACWLGRWTAADPAGLVDGVNLYRYARGNPVSLLDDSGLASGDAGGGRRHESPPPDVDAKLPPTFILDLLASSGDVGEVHVYFAYGRAEVDAQDVEALTQLRRVIRGGNRSVITVEAFADERGAEGYNRKLSLQRAEAVRRVLQDEVTGSLDVTFAAVEGRGEVEGEPASYPKDRVAIVRLGVFPDTSSSEESEEAAPGGGAEEHDRLCEAFVRETYRNLLREHPGFKEAYEEVTNGGDINDFGLLFRVKAATPDVAAVDGEIDRLITQALLRRGSGDSPPEADEGKRIGRLSRGQRLQLQVLEYRVAALEIFAHSNMYERDSKEHKALWTRYDNLSRQLVLWKQSIDAE